MRGGLLTAKPSLLSSECATPKKNVIAKEKFWIQIPGGSRPQKAVCA